MKDIPEMFNQWAAGLGEGHDKHLTIKCGFGDEQASIILHNRGEVDTLTRVDAYAVCKALIEAYSINKYEFRQDAVYSDIEIKHDQLLKGVGFHGMYMPQGEGFTLTLTGTLSRSEVNRVQQESDVQNEQRKKRWNFKR